MKKFRVFLNIICVIVALGSIMTIVSLAETENEDVTVDVETTISQTKETTEKTTEDTTTESTTQESTTTTEETTTTSQSTSETTTTETTTEDDYYSNYDDDDDDDDVGGTKATRSTSTQSKTTKRTTVAKNINDYGARYRPLKWTCYILAGVSLVAFVVINVNYIRNGDSDEDKKKKHSTNKDVRK